MLSMQPTAFSSKDNDVPRLLPGAFSISAEIRGRYFNSWDNIMFLPQKSSPCHYFVTKEDDCTFSELLKIRR